MANPNIEDGVKRCLDNAEILLKDAKILLKEGSAGHAMLFVITAVEESSKAFILAGNSLENKTTNEIKKISN